MANAEQMDAGTLAFSAGVAATSYDQGDQNSPQKRQEYENVQSWFKRIKAARKFDESARICFYLDRKYLNGDRGGNDVEVPIASTYVDVLQSFLYARNPSVSVGPSQLTQPPPQKQMLDMAIEQIKAKRQGELQNMQQAMAVAKQATASMDSQQVAQLADMGKKALIEQGAGQPGGPMMPPPPNPDGTPTPPPQVGDISDNDPDVVALLAQMMAPYQRKRDDAKQFGDTVEIVIGQLWQKANLRSAYKEKVLSALSVGLGWTKSFWMERRGYDPTTQQKIEDVQARLAQIDALRTDLASGESANEDNDRAVLAQELAALKSTEQVTLSRGFVTDFLAAEDVQVSTDVPLVRYRNAAWIAHRDFPTVDDVKADYPDIRKELESATRYYPKKQMDRNVKETAEEVRQSNSEVSASQADSYSSSQSEVGVDNDSLACVCRWEIWDRNTGNVITLIEGMKCYAKAPYVPEISTTRFYPHFLLGIGFLSGSRQPRSLITRSMKLFDEYNAIRSNYREARRRAIPKTAYNRTMIEGEEINKLEIATTGEMVGIKFVRPDADIRTLLVPIAYPQIDPALYDTSAVRADLEMVWGVQEALSSTIRQAKTATESEIQQSGTNSRNGYMSEALDEDLDDLAIYTAEVAIQVLDQQDVEEMAGPFALWPEGLSVDDMHALLSISIDAGSAGKPKTAQQQQAWAMLLPLFQGWVEKIGQLRGASPEEIADCMEALLEETAKLTGEGFDAQQFIPDPPRVPPPPPQPTPPPMPESALMGPQTQQLEAIANSVSAGSLTPASAKALIQIAYPNAPSELIDQMLGGIRPGMTMPITNAGNAPAPTLPQPTAQLNTTQGMPA